MTNIINKIRGTNYVNYGNSFLRKKTTIRFLTNKEKTNDYEERNVEIYFADARGDTYRDSNKPRSAELHVKGQTPKTHPFPPEGRGIS